MITYDTVKRGLDLLIVVPVALATVPIQGAVAVAVRWKLGSPVFFRQERPGMHGKPFTLIKFRSMRTPRYPGEPDAERMTRMGKIMRSTSLDELPSLWNVIRGDMSLVGPRPLLMEYLELYTQDQARRHEVRPGITGLAQVSGRNAIDWSERFAFDIHYIDNRSALLDLKILGRTVRHVVAPTGISAEGHATMPRYTGPTDAEPE